VPKTIHTAVQNSILLSRISPKMTEHSPDCFVAIARAFKGGRLSFEEFLDKNLEHFSGLRHKEDAINTDTKIIDLS
jgi:hypothetical protein